MSKGLRKSIPVCKSDLLQDVTIALGRRMKSIRHVHKKLSFSVSFDQKASNLERLDIEAVESLGVRKKIALWEDGLAWFWYKEPQTAAFECHSRINILQPDGIAELIRTSLYEFEKAKQYWLEYKI